MAEYVRLRAPREHGQTLQTPSLDQSRACIESNRELLKSYPTELTSIRQIARREIRQLAEQYTCRYLNLNEAAASDGIVMSGHQPTLFHPGVWFKNWALGSVAEFSNSIAISLVVDNDLCSDLSVFCPQRYPDGKASLHRVHLDKTVAPVPYEMRSVSDGELFESFGARLSNSIGDLVADPLIVDLWPEVLKMSAQFDSLPAKLAAGRHRLEAMNGLYNLELPISRLATSHSFASFTKLLVERSGRFVEVYNSSLSEYRRANRIRSRSHPVPELEVSQEWNELPFWIWTKDNPQRRRLYCKSSGSTFDLTDRESWSVSTAVKNFVDSFIQWNNADSDIFIRPRALSTTMFARLFASDLFLHGIGGSKYDQLGDEIVRSFFDIAPTTFMTLTATMKLPILHDRVTDGDITALETQIRSLRYHPEFYLKNDELAQAKRLLVQNRPQSGSCKGWHDEIALINKELFARLSERRIELENQTEEARKLIRSSKIFDSREFSFVLFPGQLIEELRTAARL